MYLFYIYFILFYLFSSVGQVLFWLLFSTTLATVNLEKKKNNRNNLNKRIHHQTLNHYHQA